MSLNRGKSRGGPFQWKTLERHFALEPKKLLWIDYLAIWIAPGYSEISNCLSKIRLFCYSETSTFTMRIDPEEVDELQSIITGRVMNRPRNIFVDTSFQLVYPPS